jgi:predicted AAA+ superfamily ATPase
MLSRQCKPLISNSFFLFGARGTGKSTLLSSYFGDSKVLYIDLLKAEVYDKLLQSHRWLESEATSKKYDWIVIDEVQRLPELLNTVHRLIESHKVKFALTGSSSRKLKRGGANLLAGRAFLNALHPLTNIELGDKFILSDALHHGTLPAMLQLPTALDKREYLKTYAHVYLREEILMEQLVRKIAPFREFLTVAAQCSSKIVNYSVLSREAGVQVPTVQNYFQILVDTYLGFYLPSFHLSIRKSQIDAPKFYFFDNGVKKALENSLSEAPSVGTSSYGELFESFVMQEVMRVNDYLRLDYRMSYYKTKNGVEIDLVLTRGKLHLLVEIKSSKKIDESRVIHLEKISNDFPAHSFKYYISQSEEKYSIGKVQCMHWKNFLEEMFQRTL